MINLDGTDKEELEEFMAALNDKEAMKDLFNYAAQKLYSIEYRESGNIDKALFCEKQMDLIYVRLPDVFKW